MTVTMAVGQPADHAALPPAVHDLLASHRLGELPVRFAAQSATRIDTGGWLRRGRIWATVVGDHFVLAALGPRPAFIRLPLTTLTRAVYNHVTGELGFPPEPPSRPLMPPFRLEPLLARALLALARPSAPTSPGNPSNA